MEDIAWRIMTVEDKVRFPTETWLEPEIPNNALFLNNFVKTRNDRKTVNGQTKQGGVLIAVQNSIQHRRLIIDSKFTGRVLVQLELNDYRCLLCCIYSAPKNSPYRFSPILLLELLECLDELSRNQVTNLTKFVGDTNFDNTNWHHMESSNLDEALVLEELFGHNYQQLITGAKKQLDVILVNNTDPILNVSVDNYVKKLFKFDHQPFQLKLSLNNWFKVTKTLPEKEDFSLFLFEKANWNEIGLYIVQNPFKTFCFSNVDVVVDLWYDWLHKILEEHISKKTKHRMSLPPWVSNKTSNAIKRRNTMRKWMNKKPSPNNYLKLATLESRVSEF